MITRRLVLGTGLAFASVAATGFGATAQAAPGGANQRPIDALLVDETIAISPQMAAFVEASRRNLNVVGIKLDAGGQAGLMRVLSQSRAIVGVTSGATLFCLERMAWDRGFRLTGRSQQCSGGAGEEACRQDVAAFLSGMQPVAAAQSRTYRPSRADGTLHAWVMHKSARNQRREG